MTKRQFLAPIAILPVAAIALAGCTTNEKPSDTPGTNPAVVTGATVHWTAVLVGVVLAPAMSH